MSVINDVVMKVVGILLKDKRELEERFKALQTVVSKQIRATSITTLRSVIVFTECLYLGALVKKENPLKNVYVVRLQSGKIQRIGNMPKPIKQYEYMVHALYAITSHVRLMRGRGRFSLANLDQNEAWYFIDTEFAPRRWLKSNTIYDIALINGFDIYASTVSYLACDPESFNPVNDAGIRLSDLEGAGNVDDFYDFFSYLTSGKSKNVIWYFSTPHDISPFYEQHEAYKRLEHADPPRTGVNPWTFNKDLEYDFVFRNARVGNASGKLSELYERELGVSLSTHEHIRLHTAISDALILAELVMSRELE
jgi:hypothetical protein